MDTIINMDMTYAETLAYFRPALVNAMCMRKETNFFISQQKACRFCPDLREMKSKGEALKAIEKEIDGTTLIFIDGPGCNGKSVLATGLSQRFKGQVVDCLGLSKDGYRMNDFSDASWANMDVSLEDKVLNLLETGEKVIIVAGRFLSPLFRAIAMHCLGRHFNKVISLFCCQEDIHKVMKLMEVRTQRRMALGYSSSYDDDNDIVRDWCEAHQFMNFENHSELLVGAEACFLVDSSIVSLKRVKVKTA